MGNHLSDLDEFFETDDVATYTHTGSSAVVIKAIFTDTFKGQNPLTGSIEGQNPTLVCKSSDVAAAVPDDLFVVGGVSYYLTGSPEPDGTGITTITLSREKRHGRA